MSNLNQHDNRPQKIEDEIKKSILEYYEKNKQTCEKNYKAANSLRSNNYEEMNLEGDSFQFKNRLINTSVVILTANLFEKNILHAYSAKKYNNGKIEHYRINYTNSHSINAYSFIIGDYRVLHLEASNTGSYTPGGSADLARFVVENEYLYPSCIISFGICFGHDYLQQKLSQTIIANKIYPYFLSVKVGERGLELKSDESNYSLDFITNSGHNFSTRFQHIQKTTQSLGKNIKYGPLITGEAVVNNAKFKKEFEKIAPVDVLGGEMEGYGLARECLTRNNTIPCMIIKAICDWGVCKSFGSSGHDSENIKDKLQANAAYSAYLVLENLLQKSPHIDVFSDSAYDIFKNLLEKYWNSKNYSADPRIVENTLVVPTNKRLMCNKNLSQHAITAILQQLEHENIISIDRFGNIKKTYSK